MADASEPKPEPTRLGSYEIVRKLARGGMAELFLARSVGPEGFEKLVVVKKILPRFAENPRFVKLFLDEAKLAATLDHLHIAQVYDMGRIDGHYFFTMEYVHGQDVRSILRRCERVRRKLPIELAVMIARNVAAALHYAHERRRPDGSLLDVVHRDVSPSNILVSYDGAIKLADFGVAKASNSSVRTRTGALKGKVGYMSPEQARGAQIDRRSDVFSLGVVLWELVAVRRLFKTDNDLATIQLIINRAPPPLATARADCPPELDAIIARALAKDPADRYQTAQELERELDELAREHKLRQSALALSAALADLFAPELAAAKAAQAGGGTVTDFVVADLTTPISGSDLSVDEPAHAAGASAAAAAAPAPAAEPPAPVSFVDDEAGDADDADDADDLDDELAEDAEDADEDERLADAGNLGRRRERADTDAVAVAAVAEPPPAAPPAVDEVNDRTEIGQPPLMLAHDLPPAEVFEQAPTSIQVTPFTPLEPPELPHYASSPPPADAALQAEATIDSPPPFPIAPPGPPYPPSPLILTGPMTPPTGIPAHPFTAGTSGGYAPISELDPDTISLVPTRRWLLIGGVIALALLIILALALSGDPPAPPSGGSSTTPSPSSSLTTPAPSSAPAAPPSLAGQASEHC